MTPKMVEAEAITERIVDSRGNDVSMEQLLGQVGPGWHKLVTSLVEDLFELGWSGQLGQIKEKWGGLRFYSAGDTTEIMDDRISCAETESLATCELCGKHGYAKAWNNLWIRTLCKQHGKEAK